MPQSVDYLVIQTEGTNHTKYHFFDTPKEALYFRDKECQRWDNIYKKVDLIVTVS